jgi:hypothetical protein
METCDGKAGVWTRRAGRPRRVPVGTAGLAEGDLMARPGGTRGVR